MKGKGFAIGAVVVLIVIIAWFVYSNFPTPRQSHSETLNVPGVSDITRSIELTKGNTVNGTITVSGKEFFGIQFQVLDPNQNQILIITHVHSLKISYSQLLLMAFM
mgnify:CR=1 FL=1